MSTPNLTSDPYTPSHRSSNPVANSAGENGKANTVVNQQPQPTMRQTNTKLSHHSTPKHAHQDESQIAPRPQTNDKKNSSTPQKDQKDLEALRAEMDPAKKLAELCIRATQPIIVPISNVVYSPKSDDKNNVNSNKAQTTSKESHPPKKVDEFNQYGFTEFHYAIVNKDRSSIIKLLRAGGNPMNFKEGCTTPLMHAIKHWPEVVPLLLSAIPPDKCNSTTHPDGSELHLAVTNPTLLANLCKAGFNDYPDENGETALIRAATLGQIDSVKILLHNVMKNGDSTTVKRYINQSKTSGARLNALYSAAKNSHSDIVKLLIDAGANRSSPNPEFLKQIVDTKDINLLKNTLNFYRKSTAGVIQLTRYAAEKSWADGIKIIADWFTEKKTGYDFSETTVQLLSTTLEHCNDSATKEILRLYKKELLNPENFISMIDLIDPNLESKFFKFLPFVFKEIHTETELNFSIQSISQQLLNEEKWLRYPNFTQGFIGLSIDKLHRIEPDKETVMCLLQLSEKSQDYRLATIIKDGHTSARRLKMSNIPFERKWITDPIMRDFLSDVPSSSLISKGRWLGQKLFSPLLQPRTEPQIDGVSLSNDLIFALKEQSISTSLDILFKEYKLSGLVSQSLKHALEGLITQLYPDPATRSHAVCRFMIGYCFSTLSDNSHFTNHNTIRLMELDDHWKSVKRKVDAEVDEIEGVGSALIGSFAESLSSNDIIPLVTRLILENLNNASAESELSAHFQSTLGLLDVPAQRLAAACVSASQRWQARLPSSARSSRHNLNLPAIEAHFKQSIGQELRALKQQAKLPDQLAVGLSEVALDLVPAFQQIVFLQLDLIDRTFGVFKPLPGDPISHLVGSLGNTSAIEETFDEESSEDKSTESEGSAYLESEESNNPS
jgi:ankyrin repeat protein